MSDPAADPAGWLSVVLWGQSALTSGLAVLVAKLWLERQKLKAQAKNDDRRTDLDIEIHRDGLTLKLLETAREEIAVLRMEIERSRATEVHVIHFQQALDHIQALLMAESETDLEAAKRAASAFIVRMKRIAEARGTITNELQRAQSESHLIEREIGKDEK